MLKGRVIVATAFILPMFSSNAAEWVADLSANPSFGYDDNVFLQEDEKSSFEYSIMPSVLLSRNVENMSSKLGLGYSVQRYSSASSLDSTNPFIDFTTSYDLERMSFGLNASYREESRRNEALEDDGDFSSSDELRRRSIEPSFNYKLSERDSLNLGAQFTESDYSEEDASDNETKSLTVGWQRRFTERFSGGLSTTVSNYKLDGLTLSSNDDNYNVSITSNYSVSEVLSISGSVGFRRLNSETTDRLGNRTDSSSSGSSYQISSQYTNGLNAYSLSLSKQLSPSSSGQVNEQERINGTWSRPITETLSSNVGLSYQETDSASGNNQSKRKNLDFSPSLNWRLSSKMGLVFKYRYRQQKESGSSGDDVDSNSFSVNVNYDWDGFRVSR